MPVLSIRPLRKEDISFIVNYFLHSDEEDIFRMGIDKSKLVSPIEFKNLLETICDTPIEKTNVYYMIWMIDNKAIGYSSLRNILTQEIADIHLQIWSTEHRGKGYGAALFCMSVLEFYKLFHLKMILCEPLSSNAMPNKMLTKVGFKKWKTYLSTPAEIALTCQLNSYVINPKVAMNWLRASNLLD